MSLHLILDKKSCEMFLPEETISDEILNCEYEGLRNRCRIVGTIQANEVLKQIMGIGQNLNGLILIIDLLNLNFRKVKINKEKNVMQFVIKKYLYSLF